MAVLDPLAELPCVEATPLGSIGRAGVFQQYKRPMLEELDDNQSQTHPFALHVTYFHGFNGSLIWVLLSKKCGT